MKSCVRVQLLLGVCLIVMTSMGCGKEQSKVNGAQSDNSPNDLTQQFTSEEPVSQDTSDPVINSKTPYKLVLDPDFKEIQFASLVSEKMASTYGADASDIDEDSLTTLEGAAEAPYLAVSNSDLLRYLKGNLSAEDLISMIEKNALDVCRVEGFDQANMSRLNLGELYESQPFEVNKPRSTKTGCFSFFRWGRKSKKSAIDKQVIAINGSAALLRQSKNAPYKLISDGDYLKLDSSEKSEYERVEMTVPSLVFSSVDCI